MGYNCNIKLELLVKNLNLDLDSNEYTVIRTIEIFIKIFNNNIIQYNKPNKKVMIIQQVFMIVMKLQVFILVKNQVQQFKKNPLEMYLKLKF